MTEIGEEKVYCNKCLQETRHEVIAERRQVEPEYETERGTHIFDWITTYTMLECRGCGSVTLRKAEESNGPEYYEENFYPPQVARRQPTWLNDLPQEIISLMQETYGALHANSKRLALMGARALVDLFMTKTVGDIGGFAAKLNKLVEEGYLSTKDREILEPALEAGHAVTHRGHDPSTDDVELVFDIVENLIQKLVLKRKVKVLRQHTPKRKKKVKRK